MSAYNELVKSFERVRAYMREFYVYGFKSREEYDKKSARSYDDERRRLESWLGEHMRFTRTAEGKNVFISIDSRKTPYNPFHRAFKAKSFTDLDVTLHFILMDVLAEGREMSLAEIMKTIDEDYLSCFPEPFVYDESTLRKKLKEYETEGLVFLAKQGKKMTYRLSADCLPDRVERDLLHFFSEVAPVGTVGSFLLDKKEADTPHFSFKHHYITSTLDDDVTATLLWAMRQRSAVTLKNLSREAREAKDFRLVPLRVLVSAQNGRRHLIAYHPESNRMRAFRIDYLSDAKIAEPVPGFDELRATLDETESRIWSVTPCGKPTANGRTEWVEMLLRIEKGEEHVVRRLTREVRCGRVEKQDDCHYLFTAEVFDTNELAPWIRSFTGRIERLSFSNRTVENRLKGDMKRMYAIYGIGEEAEK